MKNVVEPNIVAGNKIVFNLCRQYLFNNLKKNFMIVQKSKEIREMLTATGYLKKNQAENLNLLKKI